MADELVPQGPRGISFDRAALIPAAAAPRFLWGDETAGYVSDWIYGSSPEDPHDVVRDECRLALRQLAGFQDLLQLPPRPITA